MTNYSEKTAAWCFLGIFGIVGCALLTPDKAADASEKRDLICKFVAAWAPDMPELERPRALCSAGADLKEIAAAYAGCSEPEK